MRTTMLYLYGLATGCIENRLSSTASPVDIPEDSAAVQEPSEDTAEPEDTEGPEEDTAQELFPPIPFSDLLNGCLNITASVCPTNVEEGGYDSFCVEDVEERNAQVADAVYEATGLSVDELKEGRYPLTVFSQYTTNSDPDISESEGKVPYASLMIYFGDHQEEIEAWRDAHTIFDESSWDYSWWAGYTALDRLECNTVRIETDEYDTVEVENAFFYSGEVSDSGLVYDTPLSNHVESYGSIYGANLLINRYYNDEIYYSSDPGYEIETAVDYSAGLSDQIFDLAEDLTDEPLIVGVNTFYTSVEFFPASDSN